MSTSAVEKAINNEKHQELVDARQSARRLLTDNEIQALHTGLALFADDLRRKSVLALIHLYKFPEVK